MAPKPRPALIRWGLMLEKLHLATMLSSGSSLLEAKGSMQISKVQAKSTPSVLTPKARNACDFSDLRRNDATQGTSALR